MTVDIGTSFNYALPRHYQATVSKYLDGQHKTTGEGEDEAARWNLWSY